MRRLQQGGMAALVWLAGAVGCASAEPMAVTPMSTDTQRSTTSTAALDFGDSTSQTLTVKAWEALNAGDYLAADTYASKCIELYEAKAKEQQAALTDFAPKESAFDQWALNDVATCSFIRGKVAVAQGKQAEAKALFETVIRDFKFAQCWDPKGWFWKVAVGSRGRINKILAETGR